MSIKNNTIVENEGFVRRFIELYDTSEPAEISRKLGISYQGAKNYLAGRLPEAKVLITIVEETKCSLNWLLKGEGEKYPESNKKTDLNDSFREIIREIVVEELAKLPDKPKSPKTMTLPIQVGNKKEEEEKKAA